MAEVRIRKLPDWVVEAFRLRAAAAGRSLEEELLNHLTEAALLPQHRSAAELAAFRETIRRKYGILRDSSDDIRPDREARG